MHTPSNSSTIHPEFIAVCCHVVAGIRRKEEIYAKTKATKNKRNKLLNPFDKGRYLDGWAEKATGELNTAARSHRGDTARRWGSGR